MDKKQKAQIIIYQTGDGQAQIKVQFKNETVWLTQKLMADLFGVSVPTVNEHLKNIFDSVELDEKSVIRNFRITAIDGKQYNTKHYNLDTIIALGYRVNSKRATQFRIWATKVLKQYLLKGYTINAKRLLEAKNKFHELQETVLFLQKQSKKELLKGQEVEILNLLSDYSRTLSLLEQYDKGKLTSRTVEKTKFILKFNDCVKIINELRKKLTQRKEAGEFFGQERGKGFVGIISGLYQTFGKKELYPTIGDKASHLFYLTIKDHPFVDGNKRSAAFLFVYFLDKANFLFKKSGEKKLNDNGLVALSLLVAESDPKDKEVMIKIIKNLIAE